MPPYVEVEHTADVALKIWADSQQQLFKEAVWGLVWILTGLKPKDIKERVKGEIVKDVIEIQDALDTEELLVDWLNEFLWRIEHKREIPIDIDFIKINEHSLNANVSFLKSNIIEIKTEIKAVTYHDLQIKKIPCWEVTIVFDI